MTIGTLAVDVLAVEILAQEPTGPEFGKASPLGLAIVVVLLVATALLIWNMNKRLKKLPENFQPEHPELDQAVDDGTLPGAIPGGAEEEKAGGTKATGPERPEPTKGS
ncbi:hypothetical protein [Rhodococcus rhodochrous]|uniref:hypothetical protein n=1 Tax=Rhodococcus rhodochrous TaxID=1829 RepID=UPI001E2DB195|nr:hypothetical protein [Rhodococcus rhodochrous]MCD2096492.1 hypothetical protein [Rhodococcus rhodochrous]MCD2121290.1 hypothetical protein [Rhodococcus rhodochrous]MCQ4136897.1 hypothetical protein [Rhodococcus rhodochrous]MDJ0019586.1 hypothetical protein [Rhodococcus rhodochrous]